MENKCCHDISKWHNNQDRCHCGEFYRDIIMQLQKEMEIGNKNFNHLQSQYQFADKLKRRLDKIREVIENEN